MLNDQERARLREEELFKADIRDEIAKAREKREAKSVFGRWVGNDNLRWVATTIAIPLSVAIWGFASNREAAIKAAADKIREDGERAARVEIETAQRNVALVIELFPSLEKPPGDPSRLNAIAVLQTLEKSGRLTPELRAAFDRSVTSLNDSYDPAIGFTDPGARKEVEFLASVSPPLTSDEVGAGAAAGDPARIALPGAQVYIHIFRDEQRSSAAKVQEATRRLGIASPGIENVVVTAQRRGRKPPQGYAGVVLLVFQESAMPIAARVVEAAMSAGVKLTIRERWKSAQFANVPDGQLEIWFTDPDAK